MLSDGTFDGTDVIEKSWTLRVVAIDVDGLCEIEGEDVGLEDVGNNDGLEDWKRLEIMKG